MNKPKEPYGYPELRLMEVTEDPLFMKEYRQKPMAGILFDRWGNEWDSAEDFPDMDFRTVDE